MSLVSALRRWLLALIALTSGWVVGLVVFVLWAGSSPADELSWMAYTGLFCLTAWLFIGAPLALLNPNLSSIPRALFAVLLSGLIGMGMLFVVFRIVVINAISLLGFLTAAVSMAGYILLRRRW